jgi:heptosyltransferase II
MIGSIFKNFIITAISFLYFVIRGSAKNKVLNPKNIIVVQNSKLGDMVCSTPVFSAIKLKYPESSVTVVGNSLNKELLNGNKQVDNYVVYDDSSFWKTLKEIRKNKFEFGTVLVPSFYGLALLFLGGVKSISTPIITNGFCPWETKSYKFLRKFVITKEHAMGSYAPREYLKLLEPINIFTDNTKKYLSFSDSAEQEVLSFFNKNNISISDFIVCVFPGVGNKIKTWDADKFAEVTDHVYKKYNTKIIVVGSLADKKQVEETLSYINKDTNVINALGLFNIDELKALISKTNMFIAVDSGPLYIAEAFDVPTIDIVGPLDEREQPPIGRLNRVVISTNRKKPAIHIMNAQRYDKKEAEKQSKDITSKMVMDEVDSLMKELL